MAAVARAWNARCTAPSAVRHRRMRASRVGAPRTDHPRRPPPARPVTHRPVSTTPPTRHRARRVHASRASRRRFAVHLRPHRRRLVYASTSTPRSQPGSRRASSSSGSRSGIYRCPSSPCSRASTTRPRCERRTSRSLSSPRSAASSGARPRCSTRSSGRRWTHETWRTRDTDGRDTLDEKVQWASVADDVKRGVAFGLVASVAARLVDAIVNGGSDAADGPAGGALALLAYGQTDGHAGLATVALITSSCVLAPATEELFFRGFVLPACDRVVGNVAVSIALTAGLFAAVHFSPRDAASLFAAGCAFGAAAVDWDASSKKMNARMRRCECDDGFHGGGARGADGGARDVQRGRPPRGCPPRMTRRTRGWRSSGSFILVLF